MKCQIASKKRWDLQTCAPLFGNIIVKIRRIIAWSTVWCRSKSFIWITMCQNNGPLEYLIPIFALQTYANKKLTARTHVKTFSGKMEFTDLTLASNVTNAIQDLYSKSSPEEQGETQAS